MTNPYRQALILADLKIRSFPGADQSDVEFIRAVLDGPAGDMPPATVPAGWKLVPMSPTQAMVDAWADACAPRDIIRAAPDDEANRLMATSDWSAMLASAPTPPATAADSGDAAKGAWRCYHCDEVFTDTRCASLHFGRDETFAPACQIKAGAEQGLLGALRDAEYAAADALQALADESTDAAKAYYAQAWRHAAALRSAEEAGYERGLADGRALGTPVHEVRGAE
ncbi:hypothetical protein [Sphingomonas sp. Marseille-Q8236]